MKKWVLTLWLVIILIVPGVVSAWSGKCVGVSDGDTISVMHGGKAEKIRLNGIDCPESGQAFGKKAKQFTSDMVFGKTVEVFPYEKDRYGRTVADIFICGKILSIELVRAGLAWHYKQYSDDEILAVLELDARNRKVGLWADSNPIPPWDWRHGAKDATATEEQPSSSPPSETIVLPPPEPTKTPATTTRQTLSIIYHGNTQSHIFHGPGCRYYNCKSCTAVFRSREEAINAGYRPCKVCNP
ncbi:MAG: thermonuclease family protein [Deltaproteobacteria bacterium]|nr:thermonuclease family protein [Deltaproteobacteria bacterium]